MQSDPTASPPEYNVTGHDFDRRDHFTYSGPIIDIHTHVTMTSPDDKSAGPAGGWGAAGSSDSAAMMLDVASEFGIGLTVTMCPPQDIAPLRARLGDRLLFNGMINKKKIDDPDDEAYRTLDQFLEAGVKIIKLWSAPRGRERGLLVDAPWRLEALRRAWKGGVRIVMVHVGDPDIWWTHTYTDVAKFGTKADQYEPFLRTVELFPEFAWIGAHMGGDPEHPDHLEAMLERCPNLYFDTSATKWQVREVSPRKEAIRSLISRYPTRFLFGSDLVTRYKLTREHYVSRYWCQRTLWESTWTGPSPIADPDFTPNASASPTPTLRGLGLAPDVLRRVYLENAGRLLGLGA